MENTMQHIKMSKLTLNIGAGEPGDKLNKALRLLETISHAKPVKTKTKKRIPTWGIRPGLAIGAKVTLRGKKAEELLKTLLKALDSKLPATKFDACGNFSFGIKEYIDIPGIEYEPSIGILGLEAAVTLTRPGFRIAHRLKKSKIGSRHRITQEQAIAFMKEKFNIIVEEAHQDEL